MGDIEGMEIYVGGPMPETVREARAMIAVCPHQRGHLCPMCERRVTAIAALEAVTYKEQALAFATKATDRTHRAPEWVQADATLSQTYATLALMAEVRAITKGRDE